MSVTDPIADMLTVIRNGLQAKKERVDIPASRIKESLLGIIKERGYIENVRRIDDGRQGILRAYLRYTRKKQAAISGLRRISTPGRRVYVDNSDIPHVYGGYGMAILSTSRGLMTDEAARTSKLGGEVLCYVW